MITCQRVEISLPLHVGDPTFTRVLDEVPQIQPFGAPVLVDYFVEDGDSEVDALVLPCPVYQFLLVVPDAGT